MKSLTKRYCQKLSSFFFIVSSFLLPNLVFAQTLTLAEKIAARVQVLVVIPIVSLIGVGAGILFTWGVIDLFILHGDDPQKRAAGIKHMIVGFVVLIIVFSYAPLVDLSINTVEELLR